MREFIPGVITPDEARYLVNLKERGEEKDLSIDHAPVKKIHDTINSLVNVSWNLPTYTRIESLSKMGHDWHVDTGNNNHMSWCNYGCSILLTDNPEAGCLEYRDGHKLDAEKHYCGLAIHSSDVEHRTNHSGTRITYLAFLSGAL